MSDEHVGFTSLCPKKKKNQKKAFFYLFYSFLFISGFKKGGIFESIAWSSNNEEAI